jgi:Putative zinc-binding metallo-peptidase
VTGQDSGVITISLTEADDATREQNRVCMGEPYRTLLGHFRHEIGHYYWNKLVRDGSRRAVFSDDRLDYGAALQRHYAEGPPQLAEQLLSAPWPVCIPGRTSPKRLPIVSILSIRWRQPAPSGLASAPKFSMESSRPKPINQPKPCSREPNSRDGVFSAVYSKSLGGNPC